MLQAGVELWSSVAKGIWCGGERQRAATTHGGVVESEPLYECI